MSQSIEHTRTQSLETAIQTLERGKRRTWWRRCGNKESGFQYLAATGALITDAECVERIRRLAIPPAWTEVRIAPSSRSPLQAVGIDASGRVQYIYLAREAERRQNLKYERIERFGQHLPLLRRVTNEHIAAEGLGKERVLAVVVRLINDLYFRLGSESSVQRYKTFGVTTLRNRHLQIKGNQLVFSFVGKHHIHHRRILVDEALARLIEEIKAIGGSKLFEYLGEDGKAYAIRPGDVNAYIKTAMGGEFSAKDFRTWGGTLLAAIYLAETGKAENDKQEKKNVVQVIKRVAEYLGNTPSVCRGCYVHPVVLDTYHRGVTLETFRRKAERIIRRQQPEYEVEELALLKLFEAVREEKGNGNVRQPAGCRT